MLAGATAHHSQLQPISFNVPLPKGLAAHAPLTNKNIYKTKSRPNPLPDVLAGQA